MTRNVKRARLIRMAQGKSLMDVQRDLGIEHSRLSMFETGRTGKMGYDALVKLARYYVCSIEDLLEEMPA